MSIGSIVASAAGALARLDGYLAVQAMVVLALSAIAGGLIATGDPKDAAMIASGLVGALSLSRKVGTNGS